MPAQNARCSGQGLPAGQGDIEPSREDEKDRHAEPLRALRRLHPATTVRPPAPLRGTTSAARHLLIAAVLGITTVGLVGVAPASSSAATGAPPCDVFASGGTACVACYSTVRALYGRYGGPRYQVTRGSNGATADIGLLNAGGCANAAAQDGFCANTVCTITRVYDQSPNHEFTFRFNAAPPAPEARFSTGCSSNPSTPTRTLSRTSSAAVTERQLH